MFESTYDEYDPLYIRVFHILEEKLVLLPEIMLTHYFAHDVCIAAVLIHLLGDAFAYLSLDGDIRNI